MSLRLPTTEQKITWARRILAQGLGVSSQLTDQRKEVAARIIAGQTEEEASRAMDLTKDGYHDHVKQIYKITGATRGMELFWVLLYTMPKTNIINVIFDEDLAE